MSVNGPLSLSARIALAAMFWIAILFLVGVAMPMIFLPHVAPAVRHAFAQQMGSVGGIGMASGMMIAGVVRLTGR